MFSESCFFGNAANVGLRRSVLNGERADMPENIVVAWSLRFPRYAMATGTPRKPFAVLTLLLCIAVCRPYTCVSENSEIPRDHPSYTTTPM